MKLFCLKISLFLATLTCQITAQELEPRSINNLPVGSNFVLGGYGFAKGNILLDPALPVEGLNSSIHTGVAAYVRSLKFFGMSSKFDVILPMVTADYESDLAGEAVNARRTGFGDLRMRFSFNFIGSQAMSVNEFQNYSPNLVSGISIQIIAPTGNYDSDYLINAGSNRWVLKPQWGIAKNYEQWSLEGYVGLWLFGENNDYLQGNTLKQQPLVTIKGHVIRTLKKNKWMCFSAGYGVGGRTEINGVARDTQISTMRLSFVYAMPISKRSSLKFSALTGIRFQRGSDFNGLALTYQYRWLKNLKTKI